jgi:hypothetical protein
LKTGLSNYRVVARFRVMDMPTGDWFCFFDGNRDNCLASPMRHRSAAMSAFDPKRTLELACAHAPNGPEIVNLRTGIWIWDASGVRGFVTLLARV